LIGHLTMGWPELETWIVHGGRQSMPFYYWNMDAPHYSEAERTWELSQDWTVDEADTLTLYFRGEPHNSPEPSYVAIEDSGRPATIRPGIQTSIPWPQRHP